MTLIIVLWRIGESLNIKYKCTKYLVLFWKPKELNNLNFEKVRFHEILQVFYFVEKNLTALRLPYFKT